MVLDRPVTHFWLFLNHAHFPDQSKF